MRVNLYSNCWQHGEMVCLGQLKNRLGLFAGGYFDIMDLLNEFLKGI